MKLDFFGSNAATERVRQILKTDLIRASAFSAIATAVKMATALIINKIISIYLGPAGIGTIGQMTNFITIVFILTGGGISSGIVKYVAEYKEHDPTKIPRLLSSALRIVLAGSSFAAILIAMGAGSFSSLILFAASYRSVFYLLACTVIFYGLNTILLAVLNGYKSFRRYNLLSITTSIIGLGISAYLVYTQHLKGALYALVLNQSVPFFVSLTLIAKEPWIKREYWTQKLDVPETKKLLKYVAMAAVASSCLPLAQLFLRSEVIKATSIIDAGLWDTVNRISNIYLLFIITSLTTYYLPRLSEIKDDSLLRHEILKTYKVIMPLVIIAAGTIYFMRYFIIKLLFTEAFTNAADLFLFQMIGDVLKIASWLLAMQLVAKAMTRIYIATEIAFSVSFFALSYFSFLYFGLVGLTYAYALNYLFYLGYMVWIFRNQLFIGKK